MTDENDGAAGYRDHSDAPAAAADAFPYPESIMRRYRRPDGSLDMPIEEIVQNEEKCKRERHEPEKRHSKYWDGKAFSKNLPF